MAAMAGLAKKYMELGQNMENLGDSQGENFYKKSFELATEAGKAGEATAQWLLALAYLHGRGVGEDREKALEYYKRGAELGDAACQQDLGCFYANGDGVEEDEEKAFELFKKSAEQGYGLAMQNLGRCYQYGIGCEESLKAAAEWYTKAAEALGDPELAQRAMMFRMMGGLIPEEDEE